MTWISTVNVKIRRKLIEPILSAVNHDIAHSVFSFIPNTAEVAFYGMLEGLDNYLNQLKIKQIEALGHTPSHEELKQILSQRIRSEKVAIKDIKLRTFIAEGNTRNDLAAHVYDITYGSLVPQEDNLVIIDDSIVRGTTLKQSIISILDRLQPKRLSSYPLHHKSAIRITMASTWPAWNNSSPSRLPSLCWKNATCSTSLNMLIENQKNS